VPPRIGQAADSATLDQAARLGCRLALISCVPEGRKNLLREQAVLLRRDRDGWRLLTAWPDPARAAARRWQQILACGPLCRRL
jgi:hypothetical protein